MIPVTHEYIFLLIIIVITQVNFRIGMFISGIVICTPFVKVRTSEIKKKVETTVGRLPELILPRHYGDRILCC
jgi:hypothetical protein